MKFRIYYNLSRIISYLPDFIINLLCHNRRWRPYHDPSDGWNLWFNSSYFKYVRRDKRRHHRHIHSWGEWECDIAGVARTCNECGDVEWRPEG